MEIRGQLGARFEALLPHLNERQRRLLLATEARLLGHGGVRAVAQVAGVSETTVRKGRLELDADARPLPGGRARRQGGGRKRAEDKDPGLVSALLALVEPDERGDPMSPLRWTTKSLRHLAEQLTGQGHVVSAATVGRLLRQQGFSLQATAKTLEGEQHPDRDAQFRYLNEQVKEHQADGEPVISVDAKKKEMLGQLPNAGREWRPKGQPIRVEDHSFFTGPKGEQAIPYGIYDLSNDAGWVNVGVDHDTAAFAVASIRRWWRSRGQHDYPQATRLLITADAGGSNSCRYRVWKAELARLAADAGLAITVCHFPPGTSKWNKIEHRLFSQITMNWRGRPLTSHEVVVNTIASTRTRTGLRVQAELDTGAYPTGVAVPKAHMEALPIQPHAFRGAWNYTIHPADLATDSGGEPPAPARRAAVLRMLADPRLTGMRPQDLDALARQLAPAQAATREQRCYQQRGGPRRKAPGAHGHPILTDPDRVLVTVIYLRQVCSQQVLADLLEVTQAAIGPAIKETRRLLEERRHAIEPTTLRLTSAQEVVDYARTGTLTIDPARSHRYQQLSDPALTGMPRGDLDRLVDRLSVRQAALVERRRHQRRGAPRLPGTRGGIFRQKITDAERILATILHLRQVCTQQALADLFDVSRGTIRNAVADVRPLLDEDGFHLPPAPSTLRSAAEVLASIAPQDDASTNPKPPR
jgi:transposase/DNA-binding transcriptional regulator YdaS (Cro superfamily)